MTTLWVCLTLWIALNLAFAGWRSYVTRETRSTQFDRKARRPVTSLAMVSTGAPADSVSPLSHADTKRTSSSSSIVSAPE
jgi:hypothetical protein